MAVCTYRRPRQLARLLPLLTAQATTVAPAAGIVVVDNDPAGGARAEVSRHAGVRYVHEPRPGIVAARNRALAEAAADGADAVVFLDDDEVPGDGWLARMVGTWRDGHPAAVSGPVVAVFDEEPSVWVRGSGAFARRTHPTGTAVPGAATNNLLLDRAALDRLGLRFDDRFGLTGGEDTVFTHTLVARGGEIRWCDEAEVLEPVPPERATPRWVRRRTYRAGTTWSAMELTLARPGRRLTTRLTLLGKALANTVLALPALLRATVTGDVGARAAASCRIVSYVGLAAGAVGLGFAEYRRTPGGPAADRPDPGRPARVLVAHPVADLYGSDRVVLETVRGLRAAGHHVVLAVPSAGALTEVAAAEGVPVEICPTPVLRASLLRPANLLRLPAALREAVPAASRLLQGARIDVVLVNTVTLPLWLALARRRGLPALCHVHEAEVSKPWLVRWGLDAPLGLARRIVVNSAFTAAVLADVRPGLAARATVVPNPVPGPPGGPTPPRADLTGGARLLYVGRLSPRKGPDVAVDALAALHASGVDARLDLVGAVFTGYEWFEDQLREQVARLGLGDDVRFHGFDADVWPHLAAADVLLVPSTREESFGNTAVEGLLAARPVVVARQDGLLEAVAGYTAVRTVAPGDADDLARAVREVLADWPAVAAAAVVDAATAAERHAPERYHRRMAEVVDQVTARAVSGERPA